MNVNTAGIPRAALFAALYNRARTQGMGMLHYDPRPMTAEEGVEILAKYSEHDPDLFFDYFKGRVMKVRISDISLNPSLYDRDNGLGAVQSVVDELRKQYPE